MSRKLVDPRGSVTTVMMPNVSRTITEFGDASGKVSGMDYTRWQSLSATESTTIISLQGPGVVWYLEHVGYPLNGPSVHTIVIDDALALEVSQSAGVWPDDPVLALVGTRLGVSLGGGYPTRNPDPIYFKRNFCYMVRGTSLNNRQYLLCGWRLTK